MEMIFGEEKKPAPTVPGEEAGKETEGTTPSDPVSGAPGTESAETGTDPLRKAAETATEEQAEAVLEVAGLDLSELSKEYAQDGRLSDESYRELEEAGFPRAVVDAYIRGVTQGQTEAKALADRDIADVLGVAGGEEGYGKLMAWATTAFSDEEKDAYNRAVNMGDKHIARLAVQGLVARYEAEYGHEPELVNGGSGRTVGDTEKDGFKSRADMVAAMSDKRYGRDPDYTREVEKKVAGSKLMNARSR